MRVLARSAVALFSLIVMTSRGHAGLVRINFSAHDSWVDAWNGGLSWPSLLVGGDTSRTITGYFVVDTKRGASQSAPWYASGYNSIVDFGLSSPMLNGRSFAPEKLSLSWSVNAFRDDPWFDELYLEAPITGRERYASAILMMFDSEGIGFSGLYDRLYRPDPVRHASHLHRRGGKRGRLQDRLGGTGLADRDGRSGP